MKITIDRKHLYNCIWIKKQTLRSISKKYGLTQENLKEICLFLEIPLPSEKVKSLMSRGKYYDPKNLRETNDIPDELIVTLYQEGLKSKIKFDAQKANDRPLSFYPDSLRQQFLLELENSINKNKRIDNEAKCISEWKKSIKKELESKKFIYKYQSVHLIRNDYFRNQDIPLNAHTFHSDSIDKIFDFLSILGNIIIDLGGALDDDNNFIIRGERVLFEIYEMQTLVPHTITVQEQKKLDDFKSGRRWISEPRIRKEDHVFDGRLVLLIKASGYSSTINFRFRDDSKNTFINQLEEIVIALYDMSEIERKKRNEAEKLAKKQEKERIARALHVENFNTELEKTKLLMQEALDYQETKLLQEYINHIEVNDLKDEKWLSWAKKKIAWSDPALLVEDDILGKKDLGLSILDIRKKWD